MSERDANDHRRLRESLGAYVLGGLEPAERHRVESHLRGCAVCTDEVARLAALPALLGRLTTEEASAGLLAAPAPELAGIVTAAGRERAGARRRLRAWQTATVAAALAAVVAGALAVAPRLDRPDRLVATARPVAADAATVTGTAAALAWEWGITVEVAVDDLPDRDAYELWAVSDHGERQRAGTWGPTAAGAATVRGASAIQRADLQRVEVTDPAGELLLAFEF